MKGIRSLWTTWILSLVLLVLADAHPRPFLDTLSLSTTISSLETVGSNRGALFGELSAGQTTTDSSSAGASSSRQSSIASTRQSPATSSLPTTTHATSFSTRSSLPVSSRSTSILDSTTLSSSIDVTNLSTILGPSSTDFAPNVSSDQMSTQRRTLIIVLSTVLGSVGIVLFTAALFLLCRYRKGRAPFRNRGVTPINDDEIESWRGTEQKQQSPILETGSPHSPRGMSIDSIALKNSPGWTWASPANLPEPPSFVARAPNSRIGLTDEAVPGEDAFIPPPKRQSSRLSKAPPGHARSKSRRSSISAKSIRSNNGAGFSDSKSRETIRTWHDHDNDSVGTALRDTDPTNSSPGTSTFDFDVLSAGGLSPRPKSKSQLREWEDPQNIGRAIA